MKNSVTAKLNTDSFGCVSVIMGAVDEANGIRETVRVILDSCDHKDLAEILIMQSLGITPECLQSINELKSESSDVPVNIYIESEPYVGVAIRDAIGYARGSHAVLMTSDFGIHPECLSRMIEASKASPTSIIKASRRTESGNFGQYDRLRRIWNYMGNLFLTVLYQTRIKDITNAAMLFPLELYRAIEWNEKDFSFLLEATLKPLRLRADFREVAAKSFPRTEGKSKNSPLKTLAYLPTALKYRVMPVKRFYPAAGGKHNID